MSERLDKFIELLKSKAKSWSDVMDEMPHPGLRIVKIGGDIVRNAILDVSTGMLLDQMFAQLPKDACLMDADGRILNLGFNASTGAYRDVYFVIVASQEWATLEEEYDIPELKIEFKRDVARDFKPTELIFLDEPPVGSAMNSRGAEYHDLSQPRSARADRYSQRRRICKDGIRSLGLQ